MGKYFQKVSLDDVYITALKGRRQRNAEGWERIVPIEKKIRPSGCSLLDEIIYLIEFEGKMTVEDLATAMDAQPLDLSGACRVITGMTLGDFLMAYRMKKVEELLTCTSLTLPEIARRCGFKSRGTMSQFFVRAKGIPPSIYRTSRRPKNFRVLYAW